MHKLTALLLISSLIALLAAVPAAAEPAPLGDQALQAAGALAGQTLGSLLGMAISFPVLGDAFSVCQHVSPPSQTQSPEEAFERMQACMIRAAAPMMFFGSGLGMGSGLGAIGGLVATAGLQGREGSVLGAVGAVFASQSLLYLLTAQQLSDLMGPPAPGAGPAGEPRLGQDFFGVQLLGAALAVLPAIAAALGYNYL